MAWKQIITYTRPNTGVAWTITPNNCETHIINTYEDTGKSVSFTKVLSEDGLTLTKTRTFDSESSLNEWRNDSVLATATNSITSDNTSKSITKTSQIGDL
tara:strand:- start:3695 stop:3994 length:300 start_codon:yes stop_codon:yes gene_type:complete